MVHSLPAVTPQGQQGAVLVAHVELPEGSAGAEATPPQVRGGGDNGGRQPSSEEGGGTRREQEESIHTCTEAIASLCIHSEEHSEPGGGGASAPPASSSSSSLPSLPALSPSPDTHPHQISPPLQHFIGLELRPPPPNISACPHPTSPPGAANPPKPEREGDEESAWQRRAAP